MSEPQIPHSSIRRRPSSGPIFGTSNSCTSKLPTPVWTTATAGALGNPILAAMLRALALGATVD